MTPAEIAELVGRYGVDDFDALLRSAGKKVQGRDRQCPLEGCAHEEANVRPRARVYEGNEAFIFKCHRCGGSADYLKLYQVVKGVDFLTAVEQLRGGTVAPTKPRLKLVRSPALELDKEKLTPEQVRIRWQACAEDDEAGRAYLEGRKLGDAMTLGVLRFATGNIEGTDAWKKELRSKAKRGFRVGLALSDVAGQLRGIQFRCVLPVERGQSKTRNITGGYSSAVYFGRPGDVVGAATVVVAEGLADTLTAMLWTRGAKDTVVVGAPGRSQLPVLADALEDAGVSVDGRLFVLVAQRDEGNLGNQSLSSFMALKARLVGRGADVVLIAEVPGEHKDIAQAWESDALPEWPPSEVERYFADEDEDAGMVRAAGAAIWQPAAALEPQGHGRDLQTLAHLLSFETSRRAICGLGNWALNQMTDFIEYAGVPLVDGDVTRIRLNLESFKAVDQKKLKFADNEVKAVVRVLAEKAPYHPVKQYLEPLKAEGEDPFLDALPAAMRLDPEKDGLQCEYVRRWMMAAVARVYQPGCQVDSMLVLHGDEGMHKSRFFEELGGPWFVRTSDELGSINFVEALRRAWIVELDELDSMVKAEYSRVKSVITRPTDYYSPKWVRANTAVPRHSVLGGSTNDPQFMPAETGDRRFWVADIGREIDRMWVRANRDWLWGWALKHFRSGEQWYLERELDVLRAEDNKKYQAQHPWRSLIEDFLRSPLLDEVRVIDLLLNDQCIGLPKGQLEARHEKTVARIMRQLKWTPGTSGKHRKRVWLRPKEQS